MPASIYFRLFCIILLNFSSFAPLAQTFQQSEIRIIELPTVVVTAPRKEFLDVWIGCNGYTWGNSSIRGSSFMSVPLISREPPSTDQTPILLTFHQFNAYPNPSSGQLTVEAQGGEGVLNLFSGEGRLLLSKPIKAQERIQLLLSAYPVGTYFLQFMSRENMETEKIILVN